MKGKGFTHVIHETVKDLHKAGVLKDQTMHKFDAMCLPPIKLKNNSQNKRNHLQRIF